MKFSPTLLHLPTLTLTLLTLTTLTTTTHATPTPSSPNAIHSIQSRDLQIRTFEQRYINNMQYSLPNSTIKLVGFKKIHMSLPELDDLEYSINALPDEWESLQLEHGAYYDAVERVMRVYFPVQRALVWHGGELVEANDLGELPHGSIDGDCAVVGRYQTEQVRGVPGKNRIEDGIIHLVEPSPVQRKHGGGNVHVYDFGWREGMMHHHHHHEHEEHHDGHHLEAREGSGGSCYQNHGNKVCSIVYNINEGRCARPSGVIKECIDYNGWPFKNCNNHSDKKAFPGSDCFVSVARGHYWNEL